MPIILSITIDHLFDGEGHDGIACQIFAEEHPEKGSCNHEKEMLTALRDALLNKYKELVPDCVQDIVSSEALKAMKEKINSGQKDN